MIKPVLLCLIILPQLKWLLHLTGAFIACVNAYDGRTFEVDYEGHRFLKDGAPYRYISGEIHYFRIHPSLWADRLMRVRHAG